MDSVYVKNRQDRRSSKMKKGRVSQISPYENTLLIAQKIQKLDNRCIITGRSSKGDVIKYILSLSPDNDKERLALTLKDLSKIELLKRAQVIKKKGNRCKGLTSLKLDKLKLYIIEQYKLNRDIGKRIGVDLSTYYKFPDEIEEEEEDMLEEDDVLSDFEDEESPSIKKSYILSKAEISMTRGLDRLIAEDRLIPKPITELVFQKPVELYEGWDMRKISYQGVIYYLHNDKEKNVSDLDGEDFGRLIDNKIMFVDEDAEYIHSENITDEDQTEIIYL